MYLKISVKIVTDYHLSFQQFSPVPLELNAFHEIEIAKN
jgi:hypothetical protein